MRNNTSYTGKLSAGTNQKVESFLKLRQELLAELKSAVDCTWCSHSPYHSCESDEDVAAVDEEIASDEAIILDLELKLKEVEAELIELGYNLEEKAEDTEEEETPAVVRENDCGETGINLANLCPGFMP